jgi:tetratricopeptide (TPR) repeat protein
MMKKAMVLLALTPLLFSYGSKPKSEVASSPAYIKEYNAGYEAQSGNDFALAITHYKNAVNEKPDFSDAWNNLGYCYRMTASVCLRESGKAYEKGLGYDPKNAEAIEYQGEYFVTMGQLEKAYANYKKLNDMGSDHAKQLKKKIDAVLNQAQQILKEYTP